MIERPSHLLTLTVIAVLAGDGHSQSLITPRFTPPVVVTPTVLPTQRLPQQTLQFQSTLPQLRTPELMQPRQGIGSVPTGPRSFSPTVGQDVSPGDRPTAPELPRVEKYSPDYSPIVFGGSPPPPPRENSDGDGETKPDKVFKLLPWLLILGLALLVIRKGMQSNN